MALIILIVIVCVVWFLIKILQGVESEPQPSSTSQQNVIRQPVKRAVVANSGISRNEFLRRKGWEDTPRKYFIAYKPFPIDILSGYTTFPFIGTQYRDNITIEDVGWFNGFAFCEVTNQYDNKAIAIYREDGKLLGYIPKGELDLFFNIFRQGCIVHAYGALSYNPEADKWLGVVAILTNKEALEGEECRFDNPNITFYETTDNLLEYIKKTQIEVKKQIE